jgi:hypothetical protein
MSQQRLPTFALSLVLAGVSAALLASGALSLTTDAKAPSVSARQEPAPIPTVPPAMVVPPIGTDAFTRPMFNSERAQGPDKAPQPTADTSNPSAASSAANESDAPSDVSALDVKGIILSDRGARAAVMSPGSGALTWVGVGQAIGDWKVESITATTVRFRNGDEVAEIKIRKDR